MITQKKIKGFRPELDEQVSIRVSIREKMLIVQEAKKLGISQSALLRERLLRRFTFLDQ